MTTRPDPPEAPAPSTGPGAPAPGLVVHTVRPGPAALEHLDQLVGHAQADDPLAPVTVVVASNYAGIATRRALAGRRARAAVTFTTLNRLAESLAGARLAAGGRRPVSGPVIAAAVRRALHDAPGLFAPVAGHPATERSLVRAHRELAALDDTALDRLAGASSRAAEVVRLHRHVSRLLRPRFSDEHELLVAAADAAADPATPLDRLGPVVVHLPRRLSPHGADLLLRLARRLPVTVVVGVTGDPDADRAARALVERLGRDAPVVDEPGGQTGPAGFVPGVRPGPAASDPVPRVQRVLTVSDPDDEIRHAVRELMAAAHRGVDLGRCALVYSTADPYARLAADALDAAGICWFGASVRTADTSLAGRALLGLLDLADRDLERRRVLAWLADAPVHWRGRPTPTAAWERLARSAGVVAGRDQWARRCARRAAEKRADADALDTDDDWRAERLRRDADLLDELAAFVDALAAELDRGAALRSWRELTRWAGRLNRLWLGGDRARRRWPEHEQRAADAVDRALERLEGLDTLDDRASLATFRRALETELADDLGRHGTFGRGVLVGPLSLATGITFEFTVVVGMAEGTLPARHREDALLPDRERRLVAPSLTTRAERQRLEHHDLLSVLASSTDSVGLVPRGDLRRTTERPPSRWVLDAVEAVDGVRPGADDLVRVTGPWVSEVPSFVAGIRRLEIPATVQEHDLHTLLAVADAGGDPAHHPLVSTRPELAAAVTTLRARASAAFTRFDGNLADGRPVTIPSPTDPARAQSATRLETWAICPHAYLVMHLLGVGVVDEPADEHRITPLTRGSLVHEVLDLWLADILADGDVPPPDQAWPAHHRDRLVALAEQACDEVEARGLVGRRIYWSRDRAAIVADLAAFPAADDTWRRERGARPHATELAFGLSGSGHGPVPIVLPDGRTIHLRGRIDRLDLTDDGTIVVTDYKTGRRADPYLPDPDDPTHRGQRLQLGLYALAARHLLGLPDAPVQAEYRFVDRAADLPQVTVDVDDDYVEELLEVVSIIVEGIEEGLFPEHPEPPGWRTHVACPYCDPDGLGTRERRRRYERKRTDPAMFPYFVLVDPAYVDAHIGDAPRRWAP